MFDVFLCFAYAVLQFFVVCADHQTLCVCWACLLVVKLSVLSDWFVRYGYSFGVFFHALRIFGCVWVAVVYRDTVIVLLTSLGVYGYLVIKEGFALRFKVFGVRAVDLGK